MFMAVNTTCRVLLLAADHQLSDMSLATLEHAYGDGLLRISQLSARNTSTPAGRRLYTEITQTVEKLWVWALDPATYPLMLYVDLDVLIARNIDDIFNFEFHTLAAATPCNTNMMRTSGFTAGVLLFRPNSEVHRELLADSRWIHLPWNGFVPRRHLVTSPLTGEQMQWYDVCVPRALNEPQYNSSLLEAHIRSLGVPNVDSAWPLRACKSYFNGTLIDRFEMVCAPKLGDQALHNHVLRRRAGGHAQWTPLPTDLGLNVDARMLNASLESARLLHFFGEPKPWDVRANSRNVAVRMYRTLCPRGHVRNPPHN